MKIYTIGFTKKTAKDFFEKIKKAQVKLLIDIRLNNSSQLAGFAKGVDLEYFLDKVCACRYAHEIIFAPTKELLDGYHAKKVEWEEYVEVFDKLMTERKAVEYFMEKYSNEESVCLLCSEDVPLRCHRRLVAEKISKMNKAEVIHL